MWPNGSAGAYIMEILRRDAARPEAPFRTCHPFARPGLHEFAPRGEESANLHLT